MKKETKRLVRYCLYVGIVMMMTTTALFALRGRCYYIDKNGEHKHVVCNCKCELKYRELKDGRSFCTRCKHFVEPMTYVFVPEKETVAQVD